MRDGADQGRRHEGRRWPRRSGRSQETQQHLAEITAEQDRLRQNLKTVAANSTYATRLLTKLNDQETQIEKLQAQVGGAEPGVAEADEGAGRLPVESDGGVRTARAGFG